MLTRSLLSFFSRLLGWTYTALWSLSFYPQPILNYRRLSTSGTSIDFSLLNILGFISYVIYNTAFYYSDQIRSQYALKNGGLMPTVQLNDVVYALHALVLSFINYSQFLLFSWWGFENSRKTLGARPSKGAWVVVLGCLIGVMGVVTLVIVTDDEDPLYGWTTIDIIYTISYVKLAATLFKYIPQVRINYLNSSTNGFSVDQILLDLVGGVASIVQLGVDSYIQGDWSGIIGNPAKLLLGNTSIFFDIIFMIQHYCLYGFRVREMTTEDTPLLEEAR